MQQRTVLALVLAASALSAASVSAQTLTGTWEIRSEGGRGGFITQSLTLTQQGAALTGTIAITGGGRAGGGGGRAGGRAGSLAGPLAIGDGVVEGSSFRFTTTVEFNGNTFTQRYSGTFEGDSMQGTVEGGRVGSLPFTGTRATSPR